MQLLNTKITALAFLCVLVACSNTATAQYGPWGWGPGLSWGAYPATNAMSAKTTIYTQRQAAQRQSLAQVNQRHQAQNQFLMNQARGQQAFAATNTRASAESFMRGGQPRAMPSSQTVPLALDPNANPAAVRAVMGAGAAPPQASAPATTGSTVATPSTSQQPRSYDEVVDWPSLLKASTFRTPRVRIETIMKKTEPGGPGLTEADYNEIVLAINRMKGSLERMSAGLNAKEYTGVVNYLDQLAARAQAAVKR